MLSGITNTIAVFLCFRPYPLYEVQSSRGQVEVLCKFCLNPLDRSMGKTQKKTGKGRIDKYYKLAK